MATAAQVLKASLQAILVQASESALEPAEFKDAIFTMNNYMLGLAAEGVNLGYTEVTDLGDDVTIPSGALRGCIYNVALDLVSDYGGEAGAFTVKSARDGLKAMRRIGVGSIVSAFPGTLPVGSGNHGCGVSRRYYPNLEAEILAEAAGIIGLESGTVEE